MARAKRPADGLRKIPALGNDGKRDEQRLDGRVFCRARLTGRRLEKSENALPGVIAELHRSSRALAEHDLADPSPKRGRKALNYRFGLFPGKAMYCAILVGDSHAPSTIH